MIFHWNYPFPKSLQFFEWVVPLFEIEEKQGKKKKLLFLQVHPDPF
jgi:hypothetical protein